MKKTIALICVTIALASCGVSNSGSRSNIAKPVETQHIATHGAGFMMDGKVQYSCSYNFKDLPAGSYTAVVQFENPANPSHPLVASKSFKFPCGPVLIESPKLESIKSKTNYQVKLVLHRDGKSGPVVDTHTEYVYFPITSKMAGLFGITTRID